MNAGDVREARRYVETLCRAVRARHALDQQAADQLATSLERVLDSIGGGKAKTTTKKATKKSTKSSKSHRSSKSHKSHKSSH